MRITRASRNQRLEYRGENDLYGFVRISHTDCPIELIGRGTSFVEGLILRAPSGQCFQPAGVRAIKFDSIEELQEYLKGLHIRLGLAAA